MKAAIITSQFTVMIDEYQIDICYNFSVNMIEGYVDGYCVMNAKFTPARITLSYPNILHMATELLKLYNIKTLSHGI